jgi:hypothetical protein
MMGPHGINVRCDIIGRAEGNMVRSTTDVHILNHSLVA